MAVFDKRIFFCDKKTALGQTITLLTNTMEVKHADFIKYTSGNSDKKLISLML
jgi:hypothetical protein